MYHFAMPETQTFKNHVQRDPAFLFAVPILLINVIVTIVTCITGAIHHGTHHLGIHIWLIIVSTALFVVAMNSRVKDIRVQDRVVRLEERLRYAALLQSDSLAASGSLSLQQIVALRFASDAELPALVARTLAERLEPKQIKESVITWRPDTHRV